MKVHDDFRTNNFVQKACLQDNNILPSLWKFMTTFVQKACLQDNNILPRLWKFMTIFVQTIFLYKACLLDNNVSVGFSQFYRTH